MSQWTFEPAHDLTLSRSERRGSLRRESDLFETGCHLAWALGVRTYLKLWHGLTVEGREHLPAKPPFVIVANHASHLDALLLAAPLPLTIRDQVFAVAAEDVFFQKTSRAVLASTFINALPISRRRATPKALAEFRQRLVEEPCAYILFPEGGRSRDGQMMDFKPGIGMMLAASSVPVVPCHINGAFEACPAGRKLPLRRPITIRVGPALVFADVANQRTGWEDIAGRLQEAVQQLAPA
ncbi:MAG: 1-acyl-sn-glycerol-3-phosphate acyltransferase [Planctomycetia bacterium]|nr:1-acyl-sn-glycerol-3-phosphate acyltransferase [Planctomycetia bacterium]